MLREDEAKLIQRAQQGDKDAVSQLYQAHVQTVYRYVYYRVGDANIAEDLTAETFLRALEKLDEYEDRGAPFLAWLYRIAHARTADYHRMKGRYMLQPLDSVRMAADADTDMESMVALQLNTQKLFELLPRLTDDQQQVLILRFVEGRSIEETAVVIHKTPGAVKSLQHRALRSLARLFEEENDTSGELYPA